MEVFKPGSKVHLLGDVEAMVTAVVVGMQSVRYWVAYWNGTKLEEQLVDDCVVQPLPSTEKTTVGFKQGIQ